MKRLQAPPTRAHLPTETWVLLVLAFVIEAAGLVAMTHSPVTGLACAGMTLGAAWVCLSAI